MAAFIKNIRHRARQPRLGRWWRLWIAGGAWWGTGYVGLVTALDGWDKGVLPVVVACGTPPTFSLALGLTIYWIRNGKRS